MKDVNLVEGIPGFAFALKNQTLAVRGEVPLSAASAFEDELARVRKKTVFSGGIGARSEKGLRIKQAGEDAATSKMNGLQSSICGCALNYLARRCTLSASVQ